MEQILLATGIKSKKTLYKYIRYEAERLGMETDKELAENGLELITD